MRLALRCSSIVATGEEAPAVRDRDLPVQQEVPGSDDDRHNHRIYKINYRQIMPHLKGLTLKFKSEQRGLKEIHCPLLTLEHKVN